MVQKTARRGRPPKFDRDEVIAAAIGAFFHSGYEATTLGDLEEATGVDRSTLYNSFGGKQGLYDLATTSYIERGEASLFEPLTGGSGDGYADVLEFLGRLRSGLTSPEAIPGCLIVNDMAAGAAPEVATRYRTKLETGLAAALTRAGHPTPEAQADVLAAAVIGVNLVSKMTADPTVIGRHVDAMISTVTDWQNAND
ncbi:MAG: TetR/AcrR family transcriptional regulator [Acidimicrobiales bacterium]